MERRWVIFFLVCAVGYIFYYQHLAKRDKEYKSWKAEQAALVAAANPDTPRSSGGEVLIADDGTSITLPSLSPTEGTELPEDSGIDLAGAPTEKVESATSRITFSTIGAKVLSWQLLPSEFVVNKDGQDGVVNGALELVPQTGDWTQREWPLEMVGGTRVESFNREKFKVTRTEDSGGTKLRFESERTVSGIRAVKTYRIPREGYLIGVDLEFTNESDARIPLASRGPGVGLGWLGGLGVPSLGDRAHGVERVVVALGEETATKQLKIDSEPIEYTADVAWGGVERKFFTALIIPDAANPAITAIAQVRNRNLSVEYQQKSVPAPHNFSIYSAGADLKIGESKKFNYSVYVGPLSHRALLKLAPPMVKGGLPMSAAAFHSLPMGFGWTRPVCLFLLKVLVWLHANFAPWGLAVILLTMLVKVVVFPLTHLALKNQAKTMYEQGRIKPQLDALTKKYKNDPQTRNIEMMKLYKEHGVNPLGPLRGCLPMLAQMPIFIGLYVLFDQSVELRGQSFLWIKDLSQPDALFHWGVTLPLIGASLNILPILMSATQFISMKMMETPQGGDEMQQAIQKQMMYMMPVMFGFILYQMPAGLMLYWVVSNVWAIGQSYFTKKIVKKEQAKYEQAAQEKSGGHPVLVVK
jgi:YidC/Oxa1 family membrane protein insertase